jgi:uncharacterized caspase-like protein
MRPRNLVFCFAALLVSASGFSGFPQAQVPSCQTRALKTVQDARRQAIAGSPDQAVKLLQQADDECGASYAVLTGIGQVYERLGDSVKAAIYYKNALLFTSQKSTGPSTPAAGPATGTTADSTSYLRPGNATTDSGAVRQKYALVVGVSKFQSPRIPQLKYSAKDARDFANVLIDPQGGRFYKENVTVLTDDQATTRAIREALASIASKALADDLVLIYFSTHGSEPSMDRSKRASGYLITTDTDVDALYATAYGMDDLANFIQQKVRAERIVTFLDTCYSGDTARNLEGSKALQVISDETFRQIAQGKGTVLVTSSTNQELSWESDEKQNSFFTLYLMESMRSRNGLGTIRQVYTDIQRTIPAAVRDYTRARGVENGKGAEQNPVIYPINDIPEIIIGAPTQ